MLREDTKGYETYRVRGRAAAAATADRKRSNAVSRGPAATTLRVFGRRKVRRDYALRRRRTRDGDGGETDASSKRARARAARNVTETRLERIHADTRGHTGFSGGGVGVGWVIERSRTK